ncbi:P44/Msp2 family outer membrane protein [Desulfuromonas sp.]|uniref:outer membrane protein n=1 Tax=Desulfuromonas sp. TaxID=892 RepID=UPI0025BA79E2|nr:P44/Msp2 family outer membrane protein [Desulfuromonas sp.]
MRNKWFISLAFMASILLSGSAFAERGPVYISAQGGSVAMNDADLTGNFNTVEIDFDPGLVLSGALGYDVGEGRIELEGAYRHNGIDGITLEGESFNPGGTFESFSLMLNSYADFPTRTPVTPFITAGAGGAYVNLAEDKSLSLDFETTDDLVFAYQGGFGVSCEISPRALIDLSYRYFATLDPQFDTTDGRSVDSQYATQNFSLGFRMTF